MLMTGTKAPDFTLEDKDGKNVSLSDFRGSRIVLFFFPKAGTSGCTLEAREFAELYYDFKDEGAVIVGVSRDSAETLKKFAQKYEMPYYLLSDPDHRVISEYGAWGEKTMYGKKVYGTVRCTYVIGGDGIILSVYDKVRPAGHAAAVLNDLRR